jgi:transposase
VRKREHGVLEKGGDEACTGSRYLWLYAQENLPEKYQELFNTLKEKNLKTAWAIKENLRELWSGRLIEWARHHFRRWYFWATHSRLKPVIKVTRMLVKGLSPIYPVTH